MAGTFYIDDDNLWFNETKSEQQGGTDPKLRIGLVIPRAEIKTGSVAEVSEGKRVGNQTLFGEYQDISYLQGYVQGKNVKSLSQFYKMNIPLIRSNNCQYYKNQRLSGEMDHTLAITRDISLGQSDGMRKQGKHYPFNDRLGSAYSPVAYIEAGKYVLGYPIVTDNSVDFLHYNDPDAGDSSFGGGHFRDGAIEPLSIRNSFANANTNFANIMIEGVKGNIMPYHQEQGNWSDGKGSCLIDNKYEFNQGAYDWYEDAQDLAVHERVFASIGDKTVMSGSIPLGPTGSHFSKWGYVSDGTYVLSPFVDEDVDKKYFKNTYRQLSDAATTELLVSSSQTLSTIGSRFKSATNGFILRPKYDGVIQTVLGTDSVAFAGLLKD